MSKIELLHQETSVTPFTLGINHRGFHQTKKNHKYLKPLYFKNSFVAFKDYKIDWYGDMENFKEMADKIIGDVKKDPSYSQRLLKDVMKIGQRLFKKDQKILKLDLKKLTNKQLADNLNRIYQLGKDISDLGMVAVIPDLRHSKLTTLLKEIIKQKIKSYHLKKAVNSYFSPLITSLKRGLVHEEKLALLRLTKRIDQQKKLSQLFQEESLKKLSLILKSKYPVVFQQLQKIEQSYNWLSFGQLGPAKKFGQFLEDVKVYLKGKKFNQEYKSLNEEKIKLKKLQERYIKEFHLDPIEKRLFKTTQDFSYNKVYRFDVLLLNFYTLDKLLREIAKRINWTVKQLRFTSPEEITKLLQNKKVVTKKEVKKRQQYCVTVIKGKDIVHLTGQKAKDYLKNKVKDLEVEKDMTVIHGMGVFLGRVSGVVKIVNSVKDMVKVKLGDILVSVQTNPDLLPAMKKAAAFATDIGGITSHAAIVARELKKPCVVGLRTATKVFKDGDRIEVDATKGDVKKI